MNHKTSALSLLKQEMAEKKRALQALEKAIADYESLWPDAGTTPVASPQISFALDVDESGRHKTLREQIKDAIARLGEHEFTVAQVDNTMKSMGAQIKGKYPRNRISITLAKLRDEGFIERTYEGAGSMPHRFRLASHT